jgi:hypothetical protein
MISGFRGYWMQIRRQMIGGSLSVKSTLRAKVRVTN